MVAPPRFDPPPRQVARLPTHTVALPAPVPTPVCRARPHRPRLLQAVLLLASLVIIWRLGQGWAEREVSLLAALALLVGGLLGASALAAWQRRSHRRAVRAREGHYRLSLERSRGDLGELIGDQRRILVEKDPYPSMCLELARARGSRLWERSPSDADFLHVRVGVGRARSTVTVRVPERLSRLAGDPLADAATAIAEWASWVPGVPLCAPLQAGTTGVCGQRAAVLAAVRALLIQLATHHAPDLVKVAAIWPADETPEWRWLRWLPHVWSSDGRTRALAADAAAARRLLQQVDQAAGEDSGEGSVGDDGAIWIVVIADPALAPVLPSRPGVHSLVLAASPQALPAGCATIVEVDGSAVGTLRQARGASVTIDRVDAADVELADAFSRALAPIRLARARHAGPRPLVVHQPLVEQVSLDGQRETLVDDAASIAAPSLPRRG